MKLEEIRPQMVLVGVDASGRAATVLAVEPLGDDALTVYYRCANEPPAERMLFRADEESLQPVETGLPWTFSGDGAEFRLAAEALRIHFAHLFDPLMAVHTSAVDPLPHQITAVYEALLPRQPLRFLLADDPGAGKTIMAGLFIKELIVRGDLRRCLIIAPGGLVDQWQDELDAKFGLAFDIFTRDMAEAARSGNPFAERNLLIARIDQLARDEALRAKLEATEWDLIVVDEAHKMAASYFGNKLSKTKRYLLGEALGGITRHLLLMTATPHNGKEEDFQAFMALLDPDRFHGKYREGEHIVEPGDLIRRMVKEELLKFDGTPLFPERRAHTVNYALSDPERILYDRVTDYVVHEMDRARRLEDDKRKGTVGFALTILQRRLASSPEAIFQSLRRRHERLAAMLEELRRDPAAFARAAGVEVLDDETLDDFYDDHSNEEAERLEEVIADRATAARTEAELRAEIACLAELVGEARRVRASGEDRKWGELRELLLDAPEMYVGNSLDRRKIIIFTEHRDTLNYLAERIAVLLGQPGAVVTIHGGVRREERRRIQEAFTQDKGVSVLVATDAAGEGVNLQRANLMINYDLPWNPNRLEQRFGRIHRIGQTEVCHLWNLVAVETREGVVYNRLLSKLETESHRLEGKVFDILGQVIDNKSLRGLLMEAIQYGDRPEVRDRLHRCIDEAFDPGRIAALAERNALASEHLTPGRVFEIKERMERAEALRLQPHFIHAFFSEAFASLGGHLKKREPGRFEITHVPACLRGGGRVASGSAPVLRQYERVCFEKDHLRLPGKPGAALLAPGHPLLDALVDLMLERHRPLLRQGAVLVDRTDESTEPRLLCVLDHAVRDGSHTADARPRVISRRLQFVAFSGDGSARREGPAPYLDYDVASPEERALAGEWWRKETAFSRDLERRALAYAARHEASDHFEEVRLRREAYLDATLRAVHDRLTREIHHWSHRYTKLKAELAAGRQPRMQPENARRRAEELTARLEERTRELRAARAVFSSTPALVGAALVVPAGWLRLRTGSHSPAASADAAARQRMEMLGMRAVMEHERSLGFEPTDVSAENLGWDIQSRTSGGGLRFIEVKARVRGAPTVTVTRNEILAALNKPESYYLAIVVVDGDTVDGPHYIRSPFDREVGFGVTSVNIDLPAYLHVAEEQARYGRKP